MDQLIQPQEQDPHNVSEATLAVVGLTPVLIGDMPFIGVMKQREIIAMPRTIAGMCDDLVNDKLPRKFKVSRPFTYMKALERFSNPMTEQEIVSIHKAFATNLSDQAVEFISFIANVHKHLADMFPVQVYDTVLGPQPVQPAADKLDDFWFRYMVIADPLISLVLAQSGALQAEQVAALVEFYPSLYEQIKTGLLTALTKRKVSQSSFLNLPPRIDQGCSVLLQKRLVEYNSNLHQVQPDPLQPPGGPVTSSAPNKSLQTPAQKAALP